MNIEAILIIIGNAISEDSVKDLVETHSFWDDVQSIDIKSIENHTIAKKVANLQSIDSKVQDLAHLVVQDLYDEAMSIPKIATKVSEHKQLLESQLFSGEDFGLDIENFIATSPAAGAASLARDSDLESYPPKIPPKTPLKRSRKENPHDDISPVEKSTGKGKTDLKM